MRIKPVLAMRFVIPLLRAVAICCAAASAQPHSGTTTYLCEKDLVVDPRTIQGQVHATDPPEGLGEVDVARGLRARDLILHGTKKERENELKAVEENAAAYPPPVFFFIARSLWREGRKEDAAFWLYAGQLRTRFDAARCGDPAAKEAVTLLSDTYGTEITEGLSEDLDAAKAAVHKVLEWDKKTGREYDPRWINLHAVTAYLGASGAQIPDTVTITAPKEQWAAIGEQTRKQFLQDFEQAAAKIQKQEESTEDDDQD